MTADLALRRYEPAGAGRVWAIHEAALRASPVEFVEDAPADADLREIAKTHLDAGGEIIVGEADGAVVATGGYLPRGDAAEIRRMRVHPDHQRRGYARRVLSLLEALAGNAGFARLVLATNERPTPARLLYADAGFEETCRESHPATDDGVVHYETEL